MPKTTQKKKVFLLGVNHLKEVDYTKLKGLKFEAILREGVNHNNLLSAENFVREPLFVIGTFIFSEIFLRLFGKDNKSIKKISADSNTPTYYVDSSISEIIKVIHNPVRVAGQFLILVLLIVFTNLGLILASLVIVSVSPLYFSEWVRRLLYFRNRIMVTNSLGIIKERKYRTALFYCGREHIEGVSELFKKNNFEIVEIK